MDQELVELARNLSQRYLIVLAPDGQGWRAWALDYPECDALSMSAEAAIAEVRRQLAEEALTCLQEGHLTAVPTQLAELLGALEERGTPEEPRKRRPSGRAIPAPAGAGRDRLEGLGPLLARPGGIRRHAGGCLEGHPRGHWPGGGRLSRGWAHPVPADPSGRIGDPNVMEELFHCKTDLETHVPVFQEDDP